MLDTNLQKKIPLRNVFYSVFCLWTPKGVLLLTSFFFCWLDLILPKNTFHFCLQEQRDVWNVLNPPQKCPFSFHILINSEHSGMDLSRFCPWILCSSVTYKSPSALSSPGVCVEWKHLACRLCHLHFLLNADVFLCSRGLLWWKTTADVEQSQRADFSLLFRQFHAKFPLIFSAVLNGVWFLLTLWMYRFRRESRFVYAYINKTFWMCTLPA